MELDPVLIALWLVGLLFFVAGMVVDHLFLSREPREAEPTEEHTGLDIHAEVWRLMRELEKKGPIL